jgi:tetratricopeptide (TPR) repeat protein
MLQAAGQARGLLEAGAQRLNAGRPVEARPFLEQAVRLAPNLSEAHHLMGVCLRLAGDAAGAEPFLRKALSMDKRQASYHASLGEALEALQRPGEAEKSYRAALAINRRCIPAVRQLTLLLTGAGRAQEALQVISPLFAAGPVTDQGLLYAYAGALRGAGRDEAALEAHRQAVAAAPTSGVAEHNLAALNGDLGRHREAEEGARRAMAKGLRAPETRLVQARALAGLGDYEPARAAFQAVLQERPLDPDAHRDLAQMIWMKTADAAQATAALDAALRAAPQAVALRRLKAKVLTYADDLAGAHGVLEAAVHAHPDDLSTRLAASQAAVKAGARSAGLAHAEHAKGLAPSDLGVETTLCEALLACGRPEEASASAQRIMRADPASQPGAAYLATAWRLLGDSRHEEIYDYERFVGAYPIEAPKGWSSLNAYLADLADALHVEHGQKTHPFDQSLRHGSQVSQLLSRPHPAIQAFPSAVRGPVRAHMAALGRGKDPLRARNQGDFRVRGAWSVKLRGGAGLHVDHIHPEGWLSSACYIQLPEAVDSGQQGWIKFGEPGVVTEQPLDAVRFVKPQAGLLVLFPSYMWHGTLPFEGDQARLTIAFDIVPKA